MEYSVGFAVTDQARTVISRVPARAWAPAVDATLAADLIAWLRLLALPETLKACEPKALR